MGSLTTTLHWCTHTYTHTHTQNACSCHGVQQLQMQVTRGYSIAVSSGPMGWGEGGGFLSAGQVTQVCLQFEVDQWTNFCHGLGFITTTYSGFLVQVSRKWG